LTKSITQTPARRDRCINYYGRYKIYMLGTQDDADNTINE